MFRELCSLTSKCSAITTPVIWFEASLPVCCMCGYLQTGHYFCCLSLWMSVSLWWLWVLNSCICICICMCRYKQTSLWIRMSLCLYLYLFHIISVSGRGIFNSVFKFVFPIWWYIDKFISWYDDMTKQMSPSVLSSQVFVNTLAGPKY